MKRVISLLLLFTLLLALPFGARAEEDYTFTPPTKRVYTVGEEADYTGGRMIYGGHDFSLSAQNCSGLETFLPGFKTVTVSVMRDAPKEYFPIVVLSPEEPILQMKDIKDTHWSYSAFGPIMKSGLFTGDDTGTLRPDAPITRAEMAALIYRAWKNDPTVMIEDSPQAAPPFSDVSAEDWYYDEVEALRKAGILRGNEQGQCLPRTNITREDAVLMLMRIQYTDTEMASVDIDRTVQASGISPADFNAVSNYAKSAVALALGGLIKGDPQNRINPKSSITRAETATIFHRMFFEGYTWTPPIIEEEKPEFPNGEGPLIFLSPSSQYENSYAYGDTNEGVQMHLVAKIVRAELEKAGYRVYLPANENLTHRERAHLSNEVGADLHIPIHSNAGGGTGTRIFYNGRLKGSPELAEAIFDQLAALTNTPKNTNNLKEDIINLAPGEDPYYELAVPTAEMALIEVEFHDNATGAKWIIEHREEIAHAITVGIINYCEQYLPK